MKNIHVSSFFFLTLVMFLLFSCVHKLYGQQKIDSSYYYYYKIVRPKKSTDLVSGVNYYINNKKRNLHNKDTLAVISDLRMIAIGQLEGGFIHESEASSIEALKLIDQLELKDSTAIQSIIGLSNHLGLVYSSLNDYDKAIGVYNTALELASKLEDSLLLINNKALVYKDQKKYELALQEFEVAYERSLRTKNKKLIFRALDNLGAVQGLLKIPEGLPNLQEALNGRIQEEYSLELYPSYMHLTEYYKDKNDKRNASYYANLALEAANKISVSYKLDALGNLISLESPEASEFIKLNDSIKISKRQIENKFAGYKYDLGKEQKRRQEIELQKEKEKRSKLLFQVLAGFILLVGLFLYYIIKSKHKKEKLEEAYNTETRISKKVHDELANDVYNVMSQLENENTNPIVVDQLEHIYNRTRDISKENNTINTEDGYLDELASMLSSYAPNDVKVIIKGIDTIKWKGITKEKKVVVYRVLQELMTNMKKHSKADLVALSFDQTSKYLNVAYSDHGIGLHEEKLVFGNGMQNMENRILSVSGTLTFDIENEKGIKAHIQIPC